MEVLWTPMPKASVNEDGDLRRLEDEIGNNRFWSVLEPAGGQHDGLMPAPPSHSMPPQ
jgi:hypothetical protein